MFDKNDRLLVNWIKVKKNLHISVYILINFWVKYVKINI